MFETKSRGYKKRHIGQCGGGVYFQENIGGGSPDFFLICARCGKILYEEEVEITGPKELR